MSPNRNSALANIAEMTICKANISPFKTRNSAFYEGGNLFQTQRTGQKTASFDQNNLNKVLLTNRVEKAKQRRRMIELKEKKREAEDIHLMLEEMSKYTIN